MKLLVVFLLMYSSITNLSLAAGKLPDKKEQKPFIVFLIHGLKGDETTFCDMESAIRETYKDRNIRVKSLTYPTKFQGLGNDGLHPYDFAKIINSKIISFMIDQGIEDKKNGYREEMRVNLESDYSIVAHSQGGLVTMSYLNSCYTKTATQEIRCNYIDGIKEKMEHTVADREKFNKLYKTKERGALTFKLDKKKLLADAANSEMIKDLGFNNLLFEKLPDMIGLPRKFQSDTIKDLKEMTTNFADKEGQRTPRNMKHLLCLGCPYWGSATGNSFLQKSKSEWYMVAWYKMWNMFALKLPVRQIIDLAIGGQGTSWQRHLMLGLKAMTDGGKKWIPEYDVPWINQYPQGLQVVDVAGVVPLEKISYFNLPFSKYENDVVVGAPEARIDFIYHIEHIDQNKKTLIGKTSLEKAYIPLNVSHVPLPQTNVISMACIKKNEYKTHPSFNVIKQGLDSYYGIKSQHVPSMAKHYLHKLKNFTSEIKFFTPRGYFRRFVIRKKDVKITPDAKEKGVFNSDQLRIDDNFISTTSGHNPNGLKIVNNYFQTYYHTGKFNDDYAFYPLSSKRKGLNERWDEQRGHGLQYSVDILGLETKNFEMRVLPSYNSYAEVYLRPYLPIPHTENDAVKYPNIVSIFSVGQEEVNIVSFDAENFALKSDIVNKNSLTSDQDAMRDRCYMGLMGMNTPSLSEGARLNVGVKYSADGKKITKRVRPQTEDEWKKYAPNQGKMSKSYFNRLGGEYLHAGTPLEILGRYSMGKQGKWNEISRPCDFKELHKTDCESGDCVGKKVGNKTIYGNHTHHDEICYNTTANDRYLVTSPMIRNSDNIIKVSQMSVEKMKGLRWVNVIDIDVLKPKESRKSVCRFLKDPLAFMFPDYLGTQRYYEKKYYTLE